MSLERGDRVIATEDLDAGFFGPGVPKGTIGVITSATGEGLFSKASFAVSFENEKRLHLTEQQIAKV
jgi:hypothetical protein